MNRSAAVVAGCVAVAALSMLLPWALAFDPQVWVMWGKDAFALELDTEAGPSWKPLSVLVTTILAPAGDASEALWMVVARTGALLAPAGAAVLAERLGGRIAAVAAVAAMLLSPWWLTNAALGNSEGILAAAVLWAVVAHLDGRHGAVLLLGLAAGLLRPEVWPFLGLYGLWIWRERPALRPAAVAALAAIGVGWLLPDVLGIGGAFEASSIARGVASPGSAQHAAVPFLAVLADAVEQVTVPAFLGLLAALVPWRRAGWTERAMALAALAYVLEVAISAQAGYAGNPRYLVPAAALGAVLAGVGVARLAHERRAVLAVFAVALVGFQATTVVADTRDILWRADQRTGIGVALDRAGGPRALRACGEIRSGHFWRALVAARFDLPLLSIDTPARAPGVLVRAPSDAPPRSSRVRRRGRSRALRRPRAGRSGARARADKVPADARGRHQGLDPRHGRRDAAGPPLAPRRRADAPDRGQDRVLQPGRLDQGPGRDAPGRRRRARRPAAPGRHDRRADVRQHRHRPGDRRPPQGLPRDRGDARQDVARRRSTCCAPTAPRSSSRPTDVDPRVARRPTTASPTG